MSMPAKITYGAIGTLLLACLLVSAIWPLPIILTQNVDGSKLLPADHLKAMNEIRTTLVGVLAGTAALATVGVGLRTYRLTRSGQFTDRYSRAIEQLGKDNLSVRLGGIYALERLARDSAFDRKAIADVLAAMLRASTPENGHDDDQRVSADAQAALTVLGGDIFARSKIVIDLQGAQLSGADFRNLKFRKALLASADLSMTRMQGVDLRGADLSSADLRGANLEGAVLLDALLKQTDIRGASVERAEVSPSALRDARLE